MNNAVFWDFMQRGFCKNRRLEGTYHHHHQGEKNRRARNNININYQPKHAKRHNNPEGGIFREKKFGHWASLHL
jgi:hypothetical protein